MSIRNLAVASICGIAFLAVLPGSAGAVVLGSPNLFPMGAGFGAEAPAVVTSGGPPSTVFYDLKWKNWGSATATARGYNSIYRPGGGYWNKRGRAHLRATQIGTCSDGTSPAYTQIELRIAHWPGGPLGDWNRWGSLTSICADEYGEYTSNGFCGDTHDPPRTVWIGSDVRSYKYSCSRALKLARQVNNRITSRCARSGCKIRRNRFKCKVYRNTGDLFVGVGSGNPAQRVACARGVRTVSWFHVMPWDDN